LTYPSQAYRLEQCVFFPFSENYFGTNTVEVKNCRYTFGVEDISDDIDLRQFGSLTGSSTTFCLLDLIHNWLKNLENPGSYLQYAFLISAKHLTGLTTASL
jgi:hypothetical protein